MSIHLENNNLFKFFPDHQIIPRRLHPLDAFWSQVYVSEILYFQGSINVERFIEALNKILQAFDFPLCLIKGKSNEVYIEPPQTIEESFTTLEVVTNLSSSEDIKDVDLIPVLSPVKEKKTKGRPIILLKLTLTNNGFILGFQINHGFFDLNTVIYFFKNLFHIYSTLNLEAYIEKPISIDLWAFPKKYASESLIKFSSLEELRKYSGFAYFKYTPYNMNVSRNRPPFAHKNICLRFEFEKLQELQDSSRENISKNDVLSAVLLKTQALAHKQLTAQDHMRLNCACNIRSHIGLPINTIGNLFITLSMKPISVKECRELPILTLAELYKAHREKPDISKFINMVNWFNHFDKLGESVENYVLEDGDPFNPLIFFSTSLTSVNHAGIDFNGGKLLGMRSVSNFSTANVISFETKKNRKFLTITKSIEQNNLEEIIRFGEETKMYDTEIILTA